MAKNNQAKNHEPLFHVVKRDDLPSAQAWLIRAGTIVISYFLVGIFSMIITEKGLGETFGHAHDHVVDQRTVQTVVSTILLLIVGTLNSQDIALLLHGERSVDLLGKGALGALHRHQVVIADSNRHARRNSDRKSSDTRHTLHLQ